MAPAPPAPPVVHNVAEGGSPAPHPTIGGFDGYDLNHPGTGYASSGRPSARGGNGTAFSGVPGNGGGQDSKITDPIPGNLNDGGPGGTGGSIAAVMAAVAARFS